MYKKLIWFLVSMHCFLLLKAQQQEKTFSITTKTFKQQNRVLIRWVLANAKEWRLANNNGYNIERAEIGSDNYQIINKTPLKAISIQDATQFGKESDVYACAAIVSDKPNPSNTKAVENDNFSYSIFLLMCSYNFNNAIYAAAGFADTTIQPDKQYTYRVSVAGVNIQNQKLITSSIGTANSTITDIPEITASYGDKEVMLSWNIKKAVDEYPAIIVERSLDSVIFFNITPKPLISSLQSSSKNNSDTTVKLMEYKDDDVVNNTKYYYRIKGINLFGVYSNASNIVSGECIADIKSIPKIISIDTIAKKFAITWNIDDSLKSLIKKYELYVSETANDSSYKKLTDLLPQKSNTNFQYAFNYIPKETNYFIVKAIAKKDNSIVESSPYFYQLKDSIPPTVPINLQATINTEGNIIVTWQKNTENDFKGYKIYKSVTGSEIKSFTAINGEPFEEAVFKEKVALNQLNRNIYYRITALDNKYNESGLSDYILVKRPDIIPPVAPIIKKLIAQTNNKSLQLTWAKSFSKDISNYSIYRKKYSDTTDASWQLIATTNNTDTSFTDNTIETYTSYNYKMQAIDSSNLKSNFSSVITFYAPQKPEKIKTITNLNSYVSRDKKYIELNWNVPNTDIVEIMIYRIQNRDENNALLLATIPATTKIYDDENIKENNIYTYYLKPVFKNGKSGDFVKIDVDY